MQKIAQSIVAFIITVFGDTTGKLIGVMIISMIPVIELRGGIPVGFALGLPWYANFLCAVVGNLLPVPIILFFVLKVFEFMKKYHIFPGLVHKLEAKAMKKSGKVSKAQFWGLVAFVAIPLPGTGAWTGALIASVLHINKSRAFLAICTGVLIAATIITVGAYGVVGNLL